MCKDMPTGSCTTQANCEAHVVIPRRASTNTGKNELRQQALIARWQQPSKPRRSGAARHGRAIVGAPLSHIVTSNCSHECVDKLHGNAVNIACTEKRAGGNGGASQ